MLNNLSHEDKLELYKKFNEKEFNENYRNIGRTSLKISFLTLKLLSAFAIIGGLFNPWLFLFMVPAIVIPSVCMLTTDFKRKRTIENLNKNITYKEFLKLSKSLEWKQLAIESNSQQENQIKENKIENRTRSVECCIIKQHKEKLEDNNNLSI